MESLVDSFVGVFSGSLEAFWVPSPRPPKLLLQVSTHGPLLPSTLVGTWWACSKGCVFSQLSRRPPMHLIPSLPPNPSPVYPFLLNQWIPTSASFLSTLSKANSLLHVTCALRLPDAWPVFQPFQYNFLIYGVCCIAGWKGEDCH